MFDREFEFENANPETQVSMILSNYYRGEYDFLPQFTDDPLEILFKDSESIFLGLENRNIQFTKKRIKLIQKYRNNNYGALLKFIAQKTRSN